MFWHRGVIVHQGQVTTAALRSACKTYRQPLQRKRVGLIAKERVPVREHTELQNAAGQKIGEVTSGLLGPTIDQPIAMGYVTPDFSANGAEVFAMVRGKQVPMVVAPMPFVATRYYRG